MNFFYKICIVAFIQGPKSPKNGPFWPENCQRMAFLGQKTFVFVCQHVVPCLRSIHFYAVHLFCKIAQVQVDLLAFLQVDLLAFLVQKYPKSGLFGKKMFYPVV